MSSACTDAVQANPARKPSAPRLPACRDAVVCSVGMYVRVLYYCVVCVCVGWWDVCVAQGVGGVRCVCMCLVVPVLSTSAFALSVSQRPPH